MEDRRPILLVEDNPMDVDLTQRAFAKRHIVNTLEVARDGEEALGWMARFTRFGRNLYALGSNPEGARFAGIAVRRHIAGVFILSGVLCGLVGVLWGARFGTVDAVIAPDLQLQTISSAVVGGVSIFGGSGSPSDPALLDPVT